MAKTHSLTVDDIASVPQLVANTYQESGKQILVIGISGAPATGKSTLSESLLSGLSKLGLKAQLCPMDGFHYPNSVLKEKGLTSVKGSIETFDVTSLAHLLSKAVTPNTQIILLEGNYIYSTDEDWRPVSDLIDLKIFLTASEEVLRERLISRHLAGGKSKKEALDKTERVDLVNALKIKQYESNADYVIQTH
ncbi:Phosphoribulokinase/uridine kinase domain-containing protein [Vibrio crassostreae]|nr:Phosphoribulokinase/uridine kinase domain-containing protein [Vibrio crassostreae]CAK2306888.1 Phosphoribulokinase/uridine kinase domain-containing protein [Vibrio crassostreae]